MMTLPTFTEADPSFEFLRAEQDRLQLQADRVIQETHIMDTFALHGEVSPVGGSYKYGLMVYPDLDFGVTAEAVTKKGFVALLSDIASNAYVRKLASADTVNFPSVHPGCPKGYWLGLEVPFEGEKWGFDCWFQQPDWKTGSDDIYAARLAELDQPAKDTILAIKYHLISEGTYGKQFFSTDIYDAVLDKGVRSVQDFLA